MSERPLRDKIVAQIVPQGAVIAEIGVFKGAFSQRLLDVLAPSKLYLVDPWKNQDDKELFGTWYHVNSSNNMDEIYGDVCETFRSEIASGQVEIVRGKSSDLVGKLSGKRLNFVYIDGDHRYDAVLRDLECIAPMILPNGAMMVDDHNLHGWWGDGVVRALNTFLGRNADSWQIARAVGNQVVISKIGGL